MEAFTRKPVRRVYKSDKRYQYSKNKSSTTAKRSSTDRKHNSTNYENPKNSSTDYKGKKHSANRSKSREQANTATTDSSTDELTHNYTTTNSDLDSTDDELVQHAHLTQDKIRKVPYSYWCSDSCASSHMTDDKSLFRSPLVSIRQRTILVGGGQLYANQKGTTELKVKGSGSILISDVLYVPHLGVNLLSSKRLCSKGLTFTGDYTNMAFWRHHDKILEASKKGGVYIISWIKPNLRDKAFSTVDIGDSDEQLDPHNSLDLVNQPRPNQFN
jgi:hypothetical protein